VNPSVGKNNQLVFTREDNSEIEFTAPVKVYVWCGPWENDLVLDTTLHVWFVSSASENGWVLKAVVGDIEIGDTLFFPNYFIWDQPDSVHMFLLDPPNELATDTEESSGFIVFHSLPCPYGRNVDFSIDAVIGSEYSDMPSVTVRGRFTAEETGASPLITKDIGIISWRALIRDVSLGCHRGCGVPSAPALSRLKRDVDHPQMRMDI
jgi:hypothetical protein